MADNVVSRLLDNMSWLLISEASLIRDGMHSQIRSVHEEFIMIQKFLLKSKGKRESVGNLVSSILKVAENTQDVIDTFLFDEAKRMRMNSLNRMSHSLGSIGMLQDVAMETKRVTEEIAKANSRYDYEIENHGQGKGAGDGDDDGEGDGDIGDRRVELGRHRPTFVEDDDEVASFIQGRYRVFEKLTSRKDKGRKVLSIVGMGGLGKTTLARNVYNDRLVKKRFECRAWVYVSRKFRKRELLLSILQSSTPLTEEIYKMNDGELEEELAKFLENKRYLIVLDDVWNIEVWQKIESAFPNRFNCSRILITTRNIVVAKLAKSRFLFRLRFLSEDKSFHLFNKLVFHAEVCPPQQKEYIGKILLQCCGLPLAIVVVAGLMAKGDLSIEAFSGLAPKIGRLDAEILVLLTFVYMKLPRYLKHCFLYFGFFPEDSEIPARKLIQLWMVEGFLEEEDKTGSGSGSSSGSSSSSSTTRRRKLEDVAEEYLEKLIDRNLIKVVKRRSDGGVKSFTIHDLLRDTCIATGVEENFLASPVYEAEELSHREKSTMSSSRPKRVPIYCNPSKYISSPPCVTSEVQSLLCFRDQGVLNIEKFEGFRLLRVLDFGDTVVHKVPPQIEEFIHLRYLRMNAPHLREIPLCISNLPNLETLDLRESSIVFFRENFWKMQKLRQLFILGDCDLPYDRKKEVKTMPNLEILSTISPQIVNVLDFKTVFPKVRKLGLQSSRYVVGSRLPNFSNIQTLKIIDRFYFHFHPDAFSSSLTKVTLLRTEISLSIFAALGELPNLRALKLLKNSVGVWHMECTKDSFLKLQVLHMAELDVTKWSLQSGAMKSLEYLVIKKCLELTEVPQNLMEVTTLRNVNASWCSSRLEHSLRQALGMSFRGKFEAMVESATEEWRSGAGQLGLNSFHFGGSKNL